MSNGLPWLLAVALGVVPLGFGTAQADTTNVAPRGTASQSSIDPDGGSTGYAYKAIDGNRDGNFFHGSVTHTDNGDPDPDPQLYEWWEVTLDARYSISQVLVFNRTDCCSDRIDPFRISLFDGDTSVLSQDVNTFSPDITGQNVSGMSFTLSGQVGNRVRVQLRHQDWLSLAEVEVYSSCTPTTPDGTPCDDGNACTTNDTCSGGTCVGSPVPDGTPCDDHDACTQTDTCQAGVCVGGAPRDCNDSDACTDDSCHPPTGCVHTPHNCDDGDACTDDSCDTVNGCQRVDNCTDNNPCTDDYCGPATGCNHAPHTCDDANACTDDSCDPTVPEGCVYAAHDCSDTNPCTDDSCDPATGCVHAQRCDCGNRVIEPGEVCDPPRQQGACAASEVCSLTCNACVPPPAYQVFPPAGSDSFDTQAVVSVQVPIPGVTESLTLFGPTMIQRSDPRDPGDARREIDTEIVSMNLTGNGASIGPVTLVESPTLASPGQIKAQSGVGDFPADSFFGIFFEIITTLPPPLDRLHNMDPLRMEQVINSIPPLGAVYLPAFTQRIPLFDAEGNQVALLVHAQHGVQSPFCGNGTLEPFEECDDGNTLDCDGCDSNCTLSGCGNVILCPPEQCDPPGRQNGCDVGDVCSADCGACIPRGPCQSNDDCNDNDPCTDDMCEDPGTPAATCVHVNSTAPCEDGDACTQTDTCHSGVCIGSNSVICTASDQCHVAGTCNPVSGLCSNPAKPDGTTCDDSDACTQTDTCHSGVCIGSNSVICTTSDQCHVAGTCNPASGLCSNPAKPEGTTCNDGNACTQTDTCQSGVCTGSNLVLCVASDQCHDAGACDQITGICSNPIKPDGTTCNDDNLCTTTDSCEGGSCEGGLPPNCDDGDPCTIDTCDPATRCVFTPIPDCSHCDFSTPPFPRQRCFCGVGVQCEGTPFGPFTRHEDSCLVDGWMSVGSILHDKCCLATNNAGYSCPGFLQGDSNLCHPQWDQAVADALCPGRQWMQTFGPYPAGNGGDDTNQGCRVPTGRRVPPDNAYLCASGRCKSKPNGKPIIKRDICGKYCECQ